MTLKETLLATANEQNAAYPQYEGAFDGRVLVRFKRDVVTKMGRAFVKGQVALARPTLETIGVGRYAGRQTVTAYSSLNQCDTSVFATDVEFMGDAS